MMEILHLSHRLGIPGPNRLPVGLRLRTNKGTADTALWLELRHRAFARSRVGVRQWDAEDFAREFLSKPWWRPEHQWFCETNDGIPVGTITLALRGFGEAAKPVVHWLAVLPAWRGRGIGRSLMTVLEAHAWGLGYREVWLETHVAWEEAVRLYRAMGYSDLC